MKGDAEKQRQQRADAFTKKYHVGDIAFCPIYGKCEIIKLNEKTAVCLQVNDRGNPILYGGKPAPIKIEKHLFTI